MFQNETNEPDRGAWEWINLRDLAGLLGVHSQTIQNWIGKGALVGRGAIGREGVYRPGSLCHRSDMPQIRRWAKRNSVKRRKKRVLVLEGANGKTGEPAPIYDAFGVAWYVTAGPGRDDGDIGKAFGRWDEAEAEEGRGLLHAVYDAMESGALATIQIRTSQYRNIRKTSKRRRYVTKDSIKAWALMLLENGHRETEIWRASESGGNERWGMREIDLRVLPLLDRGYSVRIPGRKGRYDTPQAARDWPGDTGPGEERRRYWLGIARAHALKYWHEDGLTRRKT